MKKLVVLLPVLSGVLWGSAGVFVRDLTEMGMDDYTLLSSRRLRWCFWGSAFTTGPC